MDRRILWLSTGWLLLALSAAVAIAIGLLILAGSIGTGFWSYFWSAIGAALLSAALALLISEVVLKPLFVRDLLGIANLRTRFADISMREIGPLNRIGWGELYANAREIDLVIADPGSWMARDLDYVVACAARRVRVRIFLAKPQGATSEQVTFAEAGLREAWTRRQNKHKRAELEIWFLDTAPTSFMARFDDEVVVAIDAGLAVEAKPDLLLHIGYEGASDVQSWIRDRWQWAESMEGTTPAWASKKPSPEPGEVRERLGTRLDTGRSDV